MKKIKNIDKFLIMIFTYIVMSLTSYGYNQEIKVSITPLDPRIKLYNMGNQKTIIDLGFFNGNPESRGKQVFQLAEVKVEIDITGDDEGQREKYDFQGVEVKRNTTTLANIEQDFSTEGFLFNKSDTVGRLDVRIKKSAEEAKTDGTPSTTHIIFKHSGDNSSEFASFYHYSFILEAEIEFDTTGAMYGFSPYGDENNISASYINLEEIIRKQLGTVIN